MDHELHTRRNDVVVLSQTQGEAFKARIETIGASIGLDQFDSEEDAEFGPEDDLFYCEFPDGRFWIFYLVR